MKTAIIYSSKHGATGKIARFIGEQLTTDEVHYFSLSEDKPPRLQDFDKVILGTAIYAVGKASKEMTKFCSINRALLENKKIGLFISGMSKEREQNQMKAAYPEFLHKLAVTEKSLGGELSFEKMNFFERLMARLIMGAKSSVSDIDHNAIIRFAHEMK